MAHGVTADASVAATALMPLEILHGAFVLLGGRARFEGAEIAALAGLRIHFTGIKPVFAGLQFADHGTHASFSAFIALIVIAARLFRSVIPGCAFSAQTRNLEIPGSKLRLAPE
jgi:hypothetical protein